MDINWTQALDQVQNLRAALEVWGVTYEVLIALGVAAFALFLISLREIVIWYLRISQLHAQMHLMSKQLSQIQSSVDQVQVQTAQVPGSTRSPVFQDAAATTEEEEQKAAAAAALKKKFNLDH